MLLSIKWLQNYVDISDLTPDVLAYKLTHAGIEVENMAQLSNATNCVVGYVLKREKHPDSEKLSVCLVDLGNHEETQIVCGASNVAQGQKVVVSKVGANLPGNIKIKATKIRGVESNGMICSLKELGIENKYVPQEFQNGIYVLDDKAPIGVDALHYLGLDDTILELKTLNRSDCLSYIGLAYEVATILDREVKKPKGEVVPFAINHDFKVTIQSDACSLYFAKIIKNVHIKPSPVWLQHYLIAVGIRPINNVVDITNFVMMELGQPLHSFDYKKLNSKQILVRHAYDNETIVTLDNQERKLIPQDLVITDGKNPVAIAGVMGGASTQIDQQTTEVLLESAVFNPLSVRKTSMRLGLRSESSTRFEKKVDPNKTLYALNRASQLLVDLANGTMDDRLSKASTLEDKECLINITLQKINKVLGIKLTEREVAETFRRLKFDFVVLNGSFVVTVPSRRQDIAIEEDLIEEIIRIHGYHQLSMSLPITDTVGQLSTMQLKIRQIKNTLIACGLDEVLTYSLVNPNYVHRFEAKKGIVQKQVKLAMPMSEDRSVMRQSLVNSLIETLQYNNARNLNDVAIFEIGKKYYFNDETPSEKTLVSGAMTGIVHETKWLGQKQEVDFYVVKGIVEELFKILNLSRSLSFVQADEALGNDYHPSKTAYILCDGNYVGLVGELHPNTQKEFDLKDTYVFEIELDGLLDTTSDTVPFEVISKYPSVSRDIAIVVDANVTAQELINAIKSKGKAILKSVEIFDLYQGDHVEKDKKSIAFSLVFESIERTLTDDEVNQAYDRIIKSLEFQYHATLRK